MTTTCPCCAKGIAGTCVICNVSTSPLHDDGVCWKCRAPRYAAGDTLHIAKEYATGIGHIEQRGAEFLVSFYGRRTWQEWASTLQSARYAVRRLSRTK